MDQITLKDYRCFRGHQSARLAPLTLIVGENSSGKTSFLAMVRALWDVAFADAVPDFKQEPYDLGSFAEVAHHRGGRAGRAETFEGGFRIGPTAEGIGFSFNVEFGRRGTAPVPLVRRIWNDTASVTVEDRNGTLKATVGAGIAVWEETLGDFGSVDEGRLAPLFLMSLASRRSSREIRDQAEPTEADRSAVRKLLQIRLRPQPSGPFASAPVRSKPRRTYDPARPSRDPEGDYVPMYLAHVFRERKREWAALKAALERFGKSAGLFDDLEIKSLGSRTSEPFQVHVRKRGERLKGPLRNVIDVGYGVSQVLPLVTEMLRPDAPSTFLLQQPEVHLHPSAQAALGTLFCHVASDERQLIVETHSDHLINRVRLDVRDSQVPLTPDDVSLLYFERDELEVKIHSLRLDAQGNVCEAPPSYGRFFMEESARSLQF